jgi:hypothetical protein
MHCDRCKQDCDPAELQPFDDQIICDACADKADAAWGLYRDAQVLLNQWRVTPIYSSAVALRALIASLLVAVDAIHVLDSSSAEVDVVADKVRAALEQAGPETRLWLQILNSSFAMHDPDDDLAVGGLAVAAVQGTGQSHRLAMVRLLGAVRVIEQVLLPSDAESTAICNEAAAIAATVTGILNDEPEINASGGDA